MTNTKMLTLSVAAYNVENYLRQNLESCVVPSMEYLEVIVVNDGSTDSTSAIAHEFSTKYPDVFRVVDKENGGYGTTVNTAKRMATGKYFKLLDGDDWVDSAGLERLIQYLKTADSDLVLTRYSEVVEGSNPVDRFRGWCSFEGSVFSVYDNINIDNSFMVCMWEMSVKTDLVRTVVSDLPDKILYTDQLFVMPLLAAVRTIDCTDINVYQYRLGRDGQSATPESRANHYLDNYMVACKCLEFLPEKDGPYVRKSLWAQRYAGYLRYLGKTLTFAHNHVNASQMMLDVDRLLLKHAGSDIYTLCLRTSRLLSVLAKTAYSLLGFSFVRRFVQSKWV